MHDLWYFFEQFAQANTVVNYMRVSSQSAQSKSPYSSSITLFGCISCRTYSSMMSCADCFCFSFFVCDCTRFVLNSFDSFYSSTRVQCINCSLIELCKSSASYLQKSSSVYSFKFFSVQSFFSVRSTLVRTFVLCSYHSIPLSAAVRSFEQNFSSTNFTGRGDPTDLALFSLRHEVRPSIAYR